MNTGGDSRSFSLLSPAQATSTNLPGLKADDPSRIVQGLFDWSQRLVGIDSAVFLLVDENELKPGFGFEIPRETARRMRFSLEDDGPIQICMTENSTRVIPSGIDLTPGMTNPWAVAVCIPLAIDSVPIGAYVAGWNAPFDINRDTLLVLEAAASMVALSVHRAHLLYQVKREEQRLRTLLDRLPIPAIGFSHSVLTVSHVNAEGRQLLGEVVGKHIFEVFHGLNLRLLDGTPVEAAQAVEELLASTRSTRLQMTAIDGSTRFMLPHVAQLGPSGGVIMLVDVTHEVRLEMQRKRFVRMVSHHLRTPLTPLMGFAEIVVSQATRPQVKEAATEIAAAVSEITSQVERLEQIADLQPLDEGSLSSSVVESVVLSAWDAADGVVGELSLDGNLDLEVLCNLDYVTTAMAEIFTNAYLHGRPPVKVHVSAEEPNAVITCTDSGEGISREWESAVFAPFLTTQGGYEAPAGGQLGLGLTLARGLIEATLGRLTYEDGSFVVRLLLATSPTDQS